MSEGPETTALAPPNRNGVSPTQADYAEARRMLKQFRRLNTLGLKAGKPLCQATTIGEVSKAAKLPPERVVWLVKNACYWNFVDEDQGKPTSEWFMWEDGE